MDVGTAKELAKKLNVQDETIKFLATPSHHKRTNYDKTIRAYRLDIEKKENKS